MRMPKIRHLQAQLKLKEAELKLKDLSIMSIEITKSISMKSVKCKYFNTFNKYVLSMVIFEIMVHFF